MRYVGARYTPKFMGAYDVTQQYENLCVVDNGLGTSYISKKPVPAGIPLTNTIYWAIYGASSGAIINIQNQIDEMKNGDVPESLQNQITSNTDDVETLKAAIIEERTNRIQNDNNLNSAISANSSNIAANTTLISNETSARQAADNSLQTQIDQIVAPSGTAPNPAEIENARIDVYGVTNSTLGDAIRKQATLSVMPRGNYSGANVDFNDFPMGISRVYGTTDPLNSPVNNPFGFVITTRDSTNINDTGTKTQLYFAYDSTRTIYIRYLSGGSWVSWRKLSDGTSIEHADVAYSMMMPGHAALTGSGIDFDTLDKGYYRVYSTEEPVHSPAKDPFGLVLVIEDYVTNFGNAKTQIYMPYGKHGYCLARYYSGGSWTSWVNFCGDYNYEVIINPGDNLYDKISNIEENTHVIINVGTYDISSIIAELPDSYDSDLHVKPGCWIEGRGMPNIICRLETKRTNNSIFKFDGGNGRISGLKINAKNTRYAIHDDYANNNPNVNFKHIIENCIISYEGITGGSYNDGLAIGGGMGANVTNVIKDNIISSDTNMYPIHYHTSSSIISEGNVAAPGKLEIKNNYLASGTIRVEALSEDLTSNRDAVIVNNNKTNGSISIVNNASLTLIPYIWNNILS